MTALSEIVAAGFDVSLNDACGLVIVPASRLTDSQREFLKSHKAAIIGELKADYVEPPKNNSLSTVCYTPNGKPILVLAKDEAHKDWLIKMNPKQE